MLPVELHRNVQVADANCDGIVYVANQNGCTFRASMNDCDIVFAISPNSASCERVFALLKNLFGEQQMSALADYVQAALMLNYNGRRFGTRCSLSLSSGNLSRKIEVSSGKVLLER